MEIELDDRWSIGGRPHGGYLLREAVRPALTEQHPDPLVVSAHFLRSPDPGTAQLQVETLRVGRRVSQLRTRVVQHGETVLETQVTTTALSADAEPHWTRSEPPSLLPVEDALRAPHEPVPGFRVGHLEFVDSRYDPEHARLGTPHLVPGELQAWLRMADGPTTPLDLLVLADALQPTAAGLGVPGWFPTLELTVYVRAIPADGWLVGRHRTQELVDGWFDEDCELWDSRGRLVCQARQLAGYRL
ncbi:MAG: acyl-CoA thioesterase [Frankiales bacterium]|nr:acyl-CoA thioesterase [Frankiales bacterium]